MLDIIRLIIAITIVREKSCGPVKLCSMETGMKCLPVSLWPEYDSFIDDDGIISNKVDDH